MISQNDHLLVFTPTKHLVAHGVGEPRTNARPPPPSGQLLVDSVIHPRFMAFLARNMFAVEQDLAWRENVMAFGNYTLMQKMRYSGLLDEGNNDY